MGEGVTYYGTDGNGQWMSDHGLEWEAEYQGRRVYYTGVHHNRRHDMAFRAKHHLPLFKREVKRSDAPFFVELWVSVDPKKLFSRRELKKFAWDEDPECDYETVVHYRPSDAFVDATLKAFMEHRAQQDREDPCEEGERPRAQDYILRPDLPPSPLPNEVIVETVFPRGPLRDIPPLCHAAYTWRFAQGYAGMIPEALRNAWRGLPPPR